MVIGSITTTTDAGGFLTVVRLRYNRPLRCPRNSLLTTFVRETAQQRALSDRMIVKALVSEGCF